MQSRGNQYFNLSGIRARTSRAHLLVPNFHLVSLQWFFMNTRLELSQVTAIRWSRTILTKGTNLSKRSRGCQTLDVGQPPVRLYQRQGAPDTPAPVHASIRLEHWNQKQAADRVLNQPPPIHRQFHSSRHSFNSLLFFLPLSLLHRHQIQLDIKNRTFNLLPPTP